MKRITCIIIILVFCFTVLCSCSNKTANGNTYYAIASDITFVKVVDNVYFDVLVHKETKVIYILNEEMYQGGMTPLLNADGRPILWEGDL